MPLAGSGKRILNKIPSLSGLYASVASWAAFQICTLAPWPVPGSVLMWISSAVCFRRFLGYKSALVLWAVCFRRFLGCSCHRRKELPPSFSGLYASVASWAAIRHTPQVRVAEASSLDQAPATICWAWTVSDRMCSSDVIMYVQATSKKRTGLPRQDAGPE